MRERQRQIPLSKEMLNLQVLAFWPPVVFFAGGIGKSSSVVVTLLRFAFGGITCSCK